MCPRHPDRVSYVRCQRCERPVCPECQRPAAVGVQCPDCVRADARNARPLTTVLGGRYVQGAQPVVTYTLIAANVAIFLLMFIAPPIRDLLIFWPAVGAVEPYRAITSGFLHGSILHLAFNMYALWIVGQTLERALGRWRYISLYFLTLLAGTIAVVMFATPGELSWRTGVVGASGAVFGLFGAIAVVLRKLGQNARQILVVIAINVVFSFTVAGISWQAHIGGLVVGALLGWVFATLPRDQQRTGGIVTVAATGAALLALYGLLYLLK